MKGMRRRLAYLLILPLARLLFWLFEVISLKEMSHGIRIIDFLATDETDSRVKLVDRALAVVESHSPALLRRMRRNLRAIVIVRTRTEYAEGRRLCLLNFLELDSGSPAEVALSLAHETTHAVIEAAGIPYRKEKRSRIERACVRAELRLATRIGDAELVDRTKKTMGLVWWEDDQMRAVRENEWRAVGTPEWLLRVMRFLRG